MKMPVLGCVGFLRNRLIVRNVSDTACGGFVAFPGEHGKVLFPMLVFHGKKDFPKVLFAGANRIISHVQHESYAVVGKPRKE